MFSPLEEVKEEVRNLKAEVEALKNKVYGKSTTLNISELNNSPCTAQLEVDLEKLANYFEKRSRENERRAKKEEAKLLTFHRLGEIVSTERSAYYFSGKADSYKRAAEKLKELLKGSKVVPEPERWIIELGLRGSPTQWVKSGKYAGVVFPSKSEAEKAIVQSGVPTWYRATRTA